MNRTYRTLWNASTGAWVAVSELTRACGKRSGGNMALAGSGVLALGLLLAPGVGLAQTYYGATGGISPGGTTNGGAAGSVGVDASAGAGTDGGAAGTSGSPNGVPGGSGLGGGGGGFSNVETGNVFGAPVNGGNGGDGSSTFGGGGGGGGDGVRITPGPAVSVLITAPVTGGGGGSGYLSGGGGGGAGVVFLGDSALTTNAQISGGNGGVSRGAGGGGGGAGVILQGAGQLTANLAITGGNGGTGTSAAAGIDLNGNGGVGVLLVGAGKVTTSASGSITGGSATNIGSGGAGVSMAAGGTIDNAGTIRGGDGGGVSYAGSNSNTGGVGSGGALGFKTGTPLLGAGGAGITGAGLTITNSGLIAGGTAGVPLVQANAITFTSGINSLELQVGYSFTGNVDATAGTSSTLVLGGNSNPAGGFDVSKLVATASATDQYVGFNAFSKTGSSTWTLTGTTTTATPWTVKAGTLAITSDSNLGASTSSLTLDGGTLRTDATMTMGRAVTLGAGNGTVDTNGNALTVSGVISGAGKLSKTGTGTLTLSGANTYTGGTTINDGTLALGVGGSLAATGAVNVSAGAGFNMSAATAHPTIGSLSGAAGSTVALGNMILTTGGDNTSTTYAGAISGAGSLIKVGSGTMSLTGTSSYFATTVNGGTLAIVNTGKVSNNNGIIGAAAGSLGAVTVSGGGASWTNTNYLYVGEQGGATLTVEDGGAVSNNRGIIGTTASSFGAVTVSGPGSTWTNSGGLMVGHEGTGTLTIEKGGKVSSSDGSIGYSASGIGHVTVSGPDSTWTTPGVLIVGNAGTGTLTIADSGQVSVNGGIGVLHVALGAGATGVLNIGAAVGSTALAAGTVTASEVRFGPGNGSLNFNHTDAAYTFGAKITGVGVLNQVAGTTTLTAANTYTGATTINGGTLRVNGSITSATTVNSGGTLGGSGTVGNTTIAAGGALAPGNSIGTLNVAGNLSFAPSSIYRVEVDAAGNNDRTNVTGTATLNGTVAVQAAAGSYAANTPYTILNATGGLAGKFAGVSSDLAFLDPTLSYDAKNVFLNLARNSTSFNAGTIAITPNQMATATALQNATAGATGDMSTVLGTLTGLSATQARAAYDSASGTGLVTLRNASAGFASTLNNQMLDRLNTAQGAAAALANSFATRPVLLAANSYGSELSRLLNTMSDAPTQQFALASGTALPSASASQGRGFWLRGSGGYQDTKGDGNAAASQQRNTALSAGFDTQLQDGLVVGVALNSSKASLSFDNTDAGKSRGTAVAVYGSYDAGPWAFKASASAGWNDNHMERTVSVGALSRVATANFNSNTLSAYGEAVYSIPMQGWTLKPVAALSVSRDKADGFTETGAGALSLQVAGQTITSTKSLLGAKASFDVGRVRLEPRALWAHEFGDLSKPMTAQFQGAASASPFQVSGVALKRDTLILGLGATGSVSKNVDLFADVQLEHNARQRNAGLMLGLRVRW